jgi:hypothetical protein
MTRLPPDFKEFLRLLNSAEVEYLIVGGYAVSFHGYPRTTGDIDVWIARRQSNADKVVNVLKQFGFDLPELSPQMFMGEKQIIRMGIPPFRIEVLTSISGVQFDACYGRRLVAEIDGTEVSLINLDDLKANKRASGRPKDLADLENLS